MAVITIVSRLSKGEIADAMLVSAGPFTATTTRSCGPSSPGVSATRAGTATTLLPVCKRQPCARSAAAVAPRATAATSQPLCASRVPRKPPMAPAPKIVSFMLSVGPWGLLALRSVRRVDAVQHARQRVENVATGAKRRIELQRIARAFALDVLGQLDDRAHRRRCELNFAGAIEEPQDHKGTGQRVSPGEQAVIAQNDRRLVADIADQPGSFVGVNRDALEVVIRELVVKLHRVEIAHR